MQNSSRCKELNQRFPGLIEAIVSALKQQSGAKVRGGSARARKADSGVTARSRG
jgi:hypothetical protein